MTEGLKPYSGQGEFSDQSPENKLLVDNFKEDGETTIEESGNGQNNAIQFIDEKQIDDPYRGLTDEERRLAIENEALKSSEKFVDEISANLKRILLEQQKEEINSNVPLCLQQYGTDCGIACARMALRYFDDIEITTDEFVSKGRELGANVIRANDVNGIPGPIATPELVQSVMKSNNIKQQNYLRSGADSQNIFINALLSNNPIEIGLPFSAIHPEDQRPRYHAIIIKGFKISESGDIEFIINDPKPELGGELKIDKKTLTKGLIKTFAVYQKLEDIQETS